jgi:hypothetical protein
MSTPSSTKTIDPGSPPYCPVCGGNKIVAPDRQSRSAVCLGCASIVRPEISVGGEVRPFLFRESELRVHPPEILKLVQHVKAKIQNDAPIGRAVPVA